jgi:transposase
MAVVDGNGLPIAVGIASGPRGEAKLVEETLDQCVLDELPERLIGDMAYDSTKLDAQLAERGVEMIAPVQPRHKNNKQDGRPLRRYKRRWKVERLFAWLFNFRRLVTRYECKAQNYLALLRLGAAIILMRAICRRARQKRVA